MLQCQKRKQLRSTCVNLTFSYKYIYHFKEKIVAQFENGKIISKIGFFLTLSGEIKVLPPFHTLKTSFDNLNFVFSTKTSLDVYFIFLLLYKFIDLGMKLV